MSFWEELGSDKLPVPLSNCKDIIYLTTKPDAANTSKEIAAKIIDNTEVSTTKNQVYNACSVCSKSAKVICNVTLVPKNCAIYLRSFGSNINTNIYTSRMYTYDVTPWCTRETLFDDGKLCKQAFIQSIKSAHLMNVYDNGNNTYKYYGHISSLTVGYKSGSVTSITAISGQIGYFICDADGIASVTEVMSNYSVGGEIPTTDPMTNEQLAKATNPIATLRFKDEIMYNAYFEPKKKDKYRIAYLTKNIDRTTVAIGGMNQILHVYNEFVVGKEKTCSDGIFLGGYNNKWTLSFPDNIKAESIGKTETTPAHLKFSASNSTNNPSIDAYCIYHEKNDSGKITHTWIGIKTGDATAIDTKQNVSLAFVETETKSCIWLDYTDDNTKKYLSITNKETGETISTDTAGSTGGNGGTGGSTGGNGGTGGATTSSMPTSAGVATIEGQEIDPSAYIGTLYRKNEYDTVSDYSLSSLKDVIGMPFQFLPNADARIGNSGYGKRFLENIVYDAPFATVIPGYSYVNSDENKGVLQKTLDTFVKVKTFVDTAQTDGAGKTLLTYFTNALSGKSSAFFRFSPDNSLYADYLNSLIFVFVHYLGIDDLEIPGGGGKKYYEYDWFNDEFSVTEYKNDNISNMNDEAKTFEKFFGSIGSIYIMYEPESELNASFTNTTKQTDIESKIMTFSSYFKEMNYFNSKTSEQVGDGMQSVLSVFSALGGNGGLAKLFNGVAEGVTAIIGGQNMRLPDMYDLSESSGNKTYTMKIVLSSPYADPESVFLYQLKPLAKLMALSLPHQIGPNSYGSPFLVQAFSKGEFNIQLGIVTNLSVTRSGDDKNSRSVYNIPSELTVTMTIEDMYSETVLTNIFDSSEGYDYSTLMSNNIGLTDFIASFCGYNLNTTEVERMFNIMLRTIKRKLKNNIDIKGAAENGIGHLFPQINRAFSDAVQKETARVSTLIQTY